MFFSVVKKKSKLWMKLNLIGLGNHNTQYLISQNKK